MRRQGSSAATATFELMITLIDGVLSEDSRRSTPAIQTPSCSEPDITTGGEATNEKPTPIVGQTSTRQQQLLKQLPHGPLYPIPASFPENCVLESPSPSSCGQETTTDKAAAVGTVLPLSATVGPLRSPDNNQPRDITYVGVGHVNYSPEFEPTSASIVIDASLSPLSSSCSEDSVQGNGAGPLMVIGEALSNEAHVLVAKPWPSPLWSSSSEESVRGNAAAAAATVIEASLSKEAQDLSSKEMPDDVEDAVQRWPSSDDDDVNDGDSQAGKR